MTEAQRVLQRMFTRLARGRVHIEVLTEPVAPPDAENPYGDRPARHVPYGLWIDGCVLVQAEHVPDDGRDFYNVYLCAVRPAHRLTAADVDKAGLTVRHVGLSLSTTILCDLVARTWISHQVRAVLGDARR